MAVFSEPWITFSARAVSAAGHPFQSVGEPLSDLGVARDVIDSMPFGDEPTVLRVRVAGEDAQNRGPLRGDWLCLGDGPLRGDWLCLGDGPPRQLPPPSWSHCPEATRWSQQQESWLDAWENSVDARYMLHAAALAGADVPLVILATCACAREVFFAARSDQTAHLRAVEAVEAAEAWARNSGERPTAAELTRLANAAYRAADHAGTVGGTRHALRAASHAAWAAASHDAESLGDGGNFPHTCAGAATWAAQALLPEGHAAALRKLANIVRREIPTAEVLRAACGA